MSYSASIVVKVKEAKFTQNWKGPDWSVAQERKWFVV